MRMLSVWLAVAALLAPLAPVAAADSCAGLDWQQAPHRAAKRALTARDLVRLRDIGPTGDDSPPAHVMALSPDAKWAAFQLRQADPDTNRYCLAMVVQPLDTGGPARFVDTGGDFILAPDGVPTIPTTAIGIAAVITPRWSPDGRWFAFLKRVDGVDQVWRADMASGTSRAITPADVEVTDFRIIDPARIVVQFAAQPTTVGDESLSGYHYDDRFVPMRSSLPIVPKSVGFAVFDIATGEKRGAWASEIAVFGARVGAAVRIAGSECTVTRSRSGGGVLAPTRIARICQGAAPDVCPAVTCENSYGPIWTAGKRIRFLRREGWARMSAAVYEWSLGARQPRRLYATGAVLADCQPRRFDELICLRETSLRPRHLVALDLARRRLHVIADPNPEVTHLDLGSVERITLTSSLGIPAFADVVLPTTYRSGRRYPLIVVQYQSRGFLRGGVGDEFPIQLFANTGFVVLSVQRPAPAGGTADATDVIDIDRRNLIGFADRRNVLSVIEQGVDALVARGIVDPGAVGITGLSDGSSSVQFAALNSRTFAAGAVSGCCWEPGQASWLGPAFSKRLKAMGWPATSSSAPAFWNRLSLVRNAKDVRFPLLFEAADDEFRAAVESVTALREVGKPADLFIFPGEFHIKWQPAHRLAAYERALDWFAFWLQGVLPSDPRRRADALRWEAMRRATP